MNNEISIELSRFRIRIRTEQPSKEGDTKLPNIVQVAQ